MYPQKSGLRKAAEIVTLVGAILETIIYAFVILFTFGFGAIVVGPILILLWVARAQAMKGSQGWAIYGIIHGFFTGWVTMAGHILFVIDNSQNQNLLPTDEMDKSL